MSYNHTIVPVPVEVMWAVLCDPRPYGRFVVGTKTIRWFEPAWPDVGSTLHHSVGVGPFHLRDSTTVVESVPGRHLRLHAGLRPFGVTRIVFDLEPADGGTRVGIEERFVEGPGNALWNPAFDGAMWLRNQELLRRLTRIAIDRAAVMAEARSHDGGAEPVRAP